MSLDHHPGAKPLVPPPPPSWGEIAPAGETAVVVRFVLDQSVVTFPAAEFKRWEHALGVLELLTISTDKEQIVVEGRELAEIRAALDLGRLCELRTNFPRAAGARPGSQVRRIAIEPV